MGLAAMRSMAGPENGVGGGRVDLRLRRPFPEWRRRRGRGCLAESIISSTRMTRLPRTSPMMFITSETLAFWRRLSMMARGQPRRAANFLARGDRAEVGETTTNSSRRSRQYSFAQEGGQQGARRADGRLGCLRSPESGRA